MATLAERFWAKVVQSEGCWQWTGAKTGDGYGAISSGGRKDGMVRAPRVSWALHFGAIPAGLVVCHRCDNPECTNPAHLFLGTHKDNAHDAIAKGRAASPPRLLGVDNPKARMLDHEGERLCVSEWARRAGLKPETLRVRLSQGEPLAVALRPLTDEQRTANKRKAALARWGAR